MARGKCFIGTSGWSYSHWARGVFYPRGVAPREWLPYYAQHFDTVEVNMSFYRLPRPEMIERWKALTPSGFRFTLKLWQRITHQKRLRDCVEPLRAFMDVAAGLGRNRGPLLVQLPPAQRKDLERLRGFLADFRRVTRPSRWKVAVEFRNTEWRCDEVYEVLDEHGAAICVADMPECEFTEPNDAAFVYIRRHGPGGRYRGCYSARHIGADARRIRQWRRAGRDVWVYYNNDIEGYAVRNAGQLIEAVGGP